MKKRVLFLSDSLCCGGSEQSLVSLLNTLDYTKIEVDLWLRNRGGVFEPYLPDQVHIVDSNLTPSNKILHWIGTKLYSLDIRLNPRQHFAELLWKRTGKYIPVLEKPYDVAISFQQGFPTFYLATKVNAKKKAARVNIDMLAAKYNADFCREFYDRCDNIIAISDALSEQIIGSKYVTDKSKVFKLINVFSVDFIRKMASEEVFIQKDCRLKIVTTGRLVKQKGYDLAIGAAKILKEKGVDFIWYFIGEGEERPMLESLIHKFGLDDNVKLLGMKANPYPYMKGGDIYVQTSLFEGFGRTVTEAKILGKAVVSTNFPTAYEQITHEENGLICEMTPDDVASKVLMLINNSALKDKIERTVTEEQYTTSQSESKKMMEYLLS